MTLTVTMTTEQHAAYMAQQAAHNEAVLAVATRQAEALEAVASALQHQEAHRWDILAACALAGELATQTPPVAALADTTDEYAMIAKVQRLVRMLGNAMMEGSTT